MNTIDPMVSALIALCKAEGGEKFVADKAVVSAENLLQITKGVKLPSGNPRGVGPGLRVKISKAYPNWLASGAIDIKNTSNSLTVPVQQAPVAINNAAINTALETLCSALEQVAPAMRDALLGTLASLVKSPGNVQLKDALLTMLTPAAFTQQPQKAA